MKTKFEALFRSIAAISTLMAMLFLSAACQKSSSTFDPNAGQGEVQLSTYTSSQVNFDVNSLLVKEEGLQDMGYFFYPKGNDVELVFALPLYNFHAEDKIAALEDFVLFSESFKQKYGSPYLIDDGFFTVQAQMDEIEVTYLDQKVLHAKNIIEELKKNPYFKSGPTVGGQESGSGTKSSVDIEQLRLKNKRGKCGKGANKDPNDDGKDPDTGERVSLTTIMKLQ